MPLVCPECFTPKSLEITFKLELPPDSRSDEIALQIVECSHCGFAGIAVYEESRRGALDSESFEHTGYRIGVDDLNILKEAVKQCPEPENSRCECRVHRTFGRQDASGRWNALDDLRFEGTFEMKL